MWWQTSVSRPGSRAAGPGGRDREVPYWAAVTPNIDDTPNDVSFEAGPDLNQQPPPNSQHSFCLCFLGHLLTGNSQGFWVSASHKGGLQSLISLDRTVVVSVVEALTSSYLSVARSSCSTSEAPWVSESSGFCMSLLGLFNHLANFSVNRKEGDYELSHGPSGVSRWVFPFRSLGFDVFKTHLNLWLCWPSAI